MIGTKKKLDKQNRLTNVLAICLALLGLSLNQWTLKYAFANVVGDDIALENKIILWIFQGFCLAIGLYFYCKGKSSEERKKLVFTFITIVAMLISIELFLQISYFVINLGDKQEIEGKKYLPPSYRDKEWVKTLFKEHKEVRGGYESFVTWASKEYHGKYVNIDSNGRRKTWNPQHLDATAVDTLYVFGGSTIWGVGARDDYTIPSHISKILNGNGYNFIVQNYGEKSYTFLQQIIHLILLLREKEIPDYVVFYDGINDIYAAYQSGVAGTSHNVSMLREKLSRKEPSLIEHLAIDLNGMFRNHCMIYKALERITHSPHQKPKFQEIASGYNEEKLELLAEEVTEHYITSKSLLEHLAKAYNFKYVCFWQPVIFLEDELIKEETNIDPRLEDQALRSLFKYSYDIQNKKQLTCFYDISDSLRGRTELCYIDFSHLSEKGNELVAHRMVEILKSHFFDN